MTVKAFLDWEERQPLKYEFDGFRPVAMTGGSVEHAVIQANLITALGTRLRGKPCRVIGSELKISVAGSIRYPDAVVVCSPIPPGAHVATAPVVSFEIVSPSTSAVDHTVKSVEYRDTPSVQRYIIIEQAKPAATVFSRAGDDWVGHVVIGDVELIVPEIDVTVPLMELYEDVVFLPDAEGPG